jgi:hypothetical protein
MGRIMPQRAGAGSPEDDIRGLAARCEALRNAAALPEGSPGGQARKPGAAKAARAGKAARARASTSGLASARAVKALAQRLDFVLCKANEMMLADEFGGRFLTAMIAYLQWRDSSLHVTLGSSGHPGPPSSAPMGGSRCWAGAGCRSACSPTPSPASRNLTSAQGT